jgi:hypothetical protein
VYLQFALWCGAIDMKVEAELCSVVVVVDAASPALLLTTWATIFCLGLHESHPSSRHLVYLLSLLKS